MTQYLRICLYLLWLSISPLTAQELIQDDYLRIIPKYIPHAASSQASRNSGPDTLVFSATQPFFDDFSQRGTVPDSNKWYISGSNRYPLITRHIAVRPPSQGAVTFDGVDAQGQAYEQLALSSGSTDVLQTHHINLSGLNVSDNVRLSFFLQPQGLGNQPDNLPPGNVDEFKVYFADSSDPGNSENNLREVFSVAGSSLKEFRQYVIQIGDPSFFHAGFYIRFESNGARYGYLDHWHLDYVYLGMNRAASDTTYNDVSPLYLRASPIAPYTAIPSEQYRQSPNLMQPIGAWLSNLKNQNVSAGLDAQISEGVSQTAFANGARLVQSVNLPPRSRLNVDLNGQFTDQDITTNASYQLELDIEAGDDVPQNDKLTEIFRLDSIFAYDDGEADAAFGLNKTRGFGVQFNLQKADTLVAVWMSFVPTVNCRVNDCGSLKYMENEAFRLTVWNAPNPDSTLYKQVAGSRVKYGDSLNHFVRFPLDFPQPVFSTFWVGIQQLSSLPIGVGYDLTYNNDHYMYWDSAGSWRPLRLGGTLMIRAEMQNGRNLFTNIIEQPHLDKTIQAKVFPNPLSGDLLRVSFSGQAYIKTHQMSIWNLQGQKILQLPQRPILDQVQIQWPVQVPAGLYLLKHEFELTDGQNYIQIEKLLIQS